MTQQDILDFLKRYQPKWFNSNEIAEALRLSKTSVNNCLKRMRKHSEVKERTVRIHSINRLGVRNNRGVLFFSFKRF